MFGPAGQVLLDQMAFEGMHGSRMESLRDLLEVYNGEPTMVEREMRAMFKDPAGYKAIQAITGVGPVMAANFWAEIGDVTRFPTLHAVRLWHGLPAWAEPELSSSRIGTGPPVTMRLLS
jgi:transposase